jgi:nicotinamide-nucleotide amidase
MTAIHDVAKYLHANAMRLATAESCTAGLVASLLGDIDGCGEWLECGFVTYSPQAKIQVLNVRSGTIEQYGLSSEEVAREMAEGALKRSGANVAISNTGVAGPENAPDGTRAGTVCFAWARQNSEGTIHVQSETCLFDGERNNVRRAAAEFAIINIIKYIERSMDVPR